MIDPRRCPRDLPSVRIPIVPALYDCDTIDDKWHAYRELQTSLHSRDISNAYDRILAKQLYFPYKHKNTDYIHSNTC